MTFVILLGHFINKGTKTDKWIEASVWREGLADIKKRVIENLLGATEC